MNTLSSSLTVVTKTAQAIGNGNWLTFNINFGVTFKSIPLVSVHGVSLFSTENIAVTSISKTSCSVKVYAPDTSFTSSIRIQAIGVV